MIVTRQDFDWLLAGDEPWTRYRVLRDLANRAEDDPAVAVARTAMVRHPAVAGLLEHAAGWPGYPLKRHNDAAHPLYAIATLADYGLERGDPGIDGIAASVLEHFDGQGFETLLWLPKFLTKQEDTEEWSWMVCDSPTLLYALLSFGHADNPDVQTAVEALAARVSDNGWRCGAADSIPKFDGPGRKDDTCPIATVYSLKALSLVPAQRESSAAAAGIEAILNHWEHQQDYKLKMFGIGTDFRKLKYPFVWYDILHVVDVLSRYPRAQRDPRFVEMVSAIETQADANGRYTAGSMYKSWKDWSFADKKHPSPWLTMLVLRIKARLATG